MRIMNLIEQAGDRQLALMGPDSTVLAQRRETVAGSDKQQNVRRLCDHALAGLEKGLRNGPLAASLT